MREKLDAAWPTIMVIGAFIAGLLVGKFQVTTKWEPGWDMVSSFGTIAAVFAAIWVAGIEKRRRYEEDDVKMRLTAARLCRPFERASNRLSKIAEDINKFDTNLTTNLEFTALLNRLRSVNLSITDMNADLLALAPLRNQAAYLLACAIGLINMAIDTGENLEKDYSPSHKSSLRIALLAKIACYSEEAAQQLERVADECRNASSHPISPHH